MILLRIPQWHPARLNELMGGHWSRAHKLKKASKQVVWAHSVSMPKAFVKRRLTIHIYLRPRQRAGDVDAYFKDACDALKSCGLIVDDSPKWLELMPVQYHREKEWWGTVFVLQNL